ncbi:AI-2E family transporter [Szabonella alba]|uniref:AI-2E family transporter n=1 Tax=Szabonella alba TaxID=2804194 RepID=UPI001F2428F4|nr:AI-2E family transporter [Szabonella alba]
MPPDQTRFPFSVASQTGSARWALIGIFIILAFAALAAGRAFLMPVTLAILLFFVFVPLRRKLDRRGVPPSVSAAAVVLILIAVLVMLVTLLSGPAGGLIDNLPMITGRLEAQFEALRGTFGAIETALEQMSDEDAESPVSGVETLLSVLAATPSLIAQTSLVLFLLFFLLASGDLLYLKIVQSFDSLGDKRRAYGALREIEDSLGSYLGSITLINAALGLSIGTLMWIWGMPSPVLFGTMAFLLNFIPYLGAVAGTAIATFVALLTFPGFQIPALVGISYFALTTIEGQLVTPYFVSRRLQMNTVVVFLAVAMWAWLWSVIGMIVAVPVLVVASVICDHVPGLEKLGNFLWGQDPPPIDAARTDTVAEQPPATTAPADPHAPPDRPA